MYPKRFVWARAPRTTREKQCAGDAALGKVRTSSNARAAVDRSKRMIFEQSRLRSQLINHVCSERDSWPLAALDDPPKGGSFRGAPNGLEVHLRGQGPRGYGSGGRGGPA